jgi:hypothetical protein
MDPPPQGLRRGKLRIDANENLTQRSKDFLNLAAGSEVHPGLIILRESGLSVDEQWTRLEPVIVIVREEENQGRDLIRLLFAFFAPLADEAKGGDGAKSAFPRLPRRRLCEGGVIQVSTNHQSPFTFHLFASIPRLIVPLESASSAPW